MPDITNPEAVRFSNEKLRVAANMLVDVYEFTRAAKDEWLANDIASVLPNTPDAIDDGADTDGRHIATGERAHAIIDLLVELLANYEANDNAKLNALLRMAGTNRG